MAKINCFFGQSKGNKRNGTKLNLISFQILDWFLNELCLVPEKNITSTTLFFSSLIFNFPLKSIFQVEFVSNGTRNQLHYWANIISNELNWLPNNVFSFVLFFCIAAKRLKSNTFSIIMKNHTDSWRANEIKSGRNSEDREKRLFVGQ